MKKHPTNRNQRRLLKKKKDKFNSDRFGHVNKVLLEEKEIINELREQSQKAIQGTDT